jgi:hypothetical protein
VLALCRVVATEEPEAALALERWEAWQRACKSGHGRGERRFRRRSYERARDCALGILLRAQLTPTGMARRCAVTRRLRHPGTLASRSDIRLGRRTRGG